MTKLLAQSNWVDIFIIKDFLVHYSRVLLKKSINIHAFESFSNTYPDKERTLFGIFHSLLLNKKLKINTHFKK